MRNIDSDLIRGNIDTIILKTMLEEDKYGLDIIKEVEQRSSGTYELKQPTLYSCLKRLENQELISSYWLDSDIGGRRHYYKLTDKGREFYNKKQEEWAKSKFIIDNLLSNYDYEEYRLVKKDEYDQLQQDKEKLANTTFNSFNSHNTMSNVATQNVEIININDNLSFEESDDFNDLYLDNNQDPDDLNYSASLTETIENIMHKNQQVDIENATSSHNFFDDNEDDEHLDIYQNDDSDNDIEDSPVYFNTLVNEPVTQEQMTITSYEPQSSDQSKNEMNILRSLHSQDDEEINTYYGDQKSYLNHLNINTDDNNINAEQQNILEINNNETSNEIDDTINNFSNSISKLYDFNSMHNNSNLDHTSIIKVEHEDFEHHENTVFRDEFNKTDSPEFEHEEVHVETDDLEELQSLNPTASSGFFKSYDDLYYQKDLTKNSSDDDYKNTISEILNNPEYDTANDDYSETDSSDASYEDEHFDSKTTGGYFRDTSFDESEYHHIQNSTQNNYEEPQYNNAFESLNEYHPCACNNEELTYNFAGNEAKEDEEIFNQNEIFDEMNNVTRETSPVFEERNPDSFVDFRSNTDMYQQSSFADIDEIITNNATSSFTASYDDAIFEPLEIKPTTSSYKEKLSNLSTYSKVTMDEEQNTKINEEAIEKAKDISVLTKEFEEEGIIVKEHYKNSTSKNFDRSYLLTNKINLIKSMIMFFGYIFVLSAVYIVLNNTPFRSSFGFSIKYFLYGFIPFAIIMIYRIALYVINPYKKTPAKYASRIMTFISIIISIQLLLITYCVNLQLGFYSFTQLGYNHLLWVIPTFISIAPIIDNLIYMALYNSKNFHV